MKVSICFAPDNTLNSTARKRVAPHSKVIFCLDQQKIADPFDAVQVSDPARLTGEPQRCLIEMLLLVTKQ